MTALEVTAGPPLPAAGQRGQTTIAERVVARVAAQAAAEVGHTGGAARQVAGLAMGRESGEGLARVSARVDGHLALIEIRLTADYPAPVRTLAREVRRHVMERVAGLTGLEVRHVDIEVTRLLRGRTGGKRE